MRRFAGIVLGQALLQSGGQADIALIGCSVALKQIDVDHRTDRRGSTSDRYGPPTLKLRRAFCFARHCGRLVLRSAQREAEWRRGWDSNPRYACTHNGFRDRPNRPLWHLYAGRPVEAAGPYTTALCAQLARW